MESDEIESRIKQAFVGKSCWYISHGGVTSPSFEMAIGEKRPRGATVANRAHPDGFRNFEGETNFLVWCTWRLATSERPIVSSDADIHAIDEGMKVIVGNPIRAVIVWYPCWDLSVIFHDGLRLDVFCDQVDDTSSIDGNWELWLPDNSILLGRRSKMEVQSSHGI